MGQGYCMMEDHKPRPILVHNQDFAKGEGLEAKVKKFSKNILILNW